MRIQVFFHFVTQPEPAPFISAVDGVDDLLIPLKGDLVTHQGPDGRLFTGRVYERTFAYDIPPGTDPDSTVTVTLFLEHVTLH